MAVRWKCPVCETGRNAPERMPSDDVRRFCLPCSAGARRMVKMESPTLEKRRLAAQERRRQNTRNLREREKAAKIASETYAGVHLPTELEKLWRAKCMVTQRRRLWKQADQHGRLERKAKGETVWDFVPTEDLPDWTARRSKSHPRHAGGHASWHRTGYVRDIYPGRKRSGRVVFTIGEETPRADVIEILAHELTHLVTPLDGHGEGFIAMLHDLLFEVYGVKIPVAHMQDDRPGRNLRAYRWDDEARKVLAGVLA